MTPATLETTTVQADFRPRRFLHNGHLQTILGNYLPRTNSLPPAEAQLVEVSPATEYQISSQVLCHCHWQPEDIRAARPTVIIVHGLEGSSESQYVVGNSNKLWQAGCNIVRMNMRNCSGTEALTPTLYHSGLSGDVDAVMRFFVDLHHLQSISLIGYSMGGNLVLKLAGELGMCTVFLQWRPWQGVVENAQAAHAVSLLRSSSQPSRNSSASRWRRASAMSRPQV